MRICQVVSGLVVFCQQFRDECDILLCILQPFTWSLCYCHRKFVVFLSMGGKTLINKFSYMSRVGVNREDEVARVRPQFTTTAQGHTRICHPLQSL